MPDGDVRLYPLFDALSGDMLLRPFYPATPQPYYISLDQIAGFVGQGSIGPEGPEGPPGPAGPEGPAGPPGTGEGASGLSGMVVGQIPIAATATTVTSSAALSGDVTSNATLVTTLATVNSNVGTFQGITVNAKGLVTAATNQSYLTTSTASSNYAPLASPALTGTPTAPTPGAGTSSTQIATTAFVTQSFATIGSPTFTGDPKAPTPATGDSDTSIATTAFVKAQNYLTANQSITLSGDVSGSGTTAISATVTQLQGRSISATAPGTNQVLAWSGSAWAPADPTGGGGGSGTITEVAAGTGLTGGGTTGSVTLNISVPVAVIHGGTGAIDAAAARTNLAVLPIANPTTTGKLTTAATVAGSAGFSLPHGTPPSTPVAGDMWTTTTGVGVRISSTTRFFAFLSGGTYTGKIITNASDSTAAGFNLPHGAAPTSPTNGDLWTTSAGGLFARINGATQNYLSGTVPVANGGTAATSLPLNAAGGYGLTGTVLKTSGTAVAPMSDATGTIGSWGNNSLAILGAASQPSLEFGRVNGSFASPTAVLSGEGIGSIVWGGSIAGSWAAASRLNITGLTTEAWTSTANGTALWFGTTLTGTLTTATRVTIQAGVVVGSPTGGDKGVGTINATAVYANNVVLTSDERLKRDITDLPKCLPLVSAIAPRAYRWCDDTESVPKGWAEVQHYGFLAQDVARVMGEVGHERGEAVSIGDLVATLWQAVRELSEGRDTLTDRVSTLEAALREAAEAALREARHE